jgi:hemerythrin-like domain-containing protein
MLPQGRRQTGLTVDPVALLKREHEMILDQLAMIETAMSPCSAGNGVAKGADRSTVRELLQFFTSRVGVHFRREEMLIAALQRILGRKQETQEQFQSFLDEHRVLKAAATAVMRTLRRKRADDRDSEVAKNRGGLRTLNSELRTLIRRYRGHISCEERILFVLAEMRLNVEQKRQISRRMLQV